MITLERLKEIIIPYGNWWMYPLAVLFAFSVAWIMYWLPSFLMGAASSMHLYYYGTTRLEDWTFGYLAEITWILYIIYWVMCGYFAFAFGFDVVEWIYRKQKKGMV